MRHGLLISAMLTCSLVPALAAEKFQDLGAVNDAASRYLSVQLASYGERASFQLGKLDNRLRLAACSGLDVELPSGNRLAGNTSLRIRCTKGAHWAVNLPAAISIQTDYWVAARSLPNGREIAEGDIEQRTGDLAQLPPGTVVDAVQAIGHTLVGGAALGAPLRADMLRPPYAVKANDTVKVLAHGAGFEVASEGRAMGSANDGQSVRVKMASGAIVQGTAHEGGMVEITY
jgi:flagella basal body P-ring formation protein FlgA